jgi:hypothetical protein
MTPPADTNLAIKYLNPRKTAMLAEIFMLKLEAIARQTAPKASTKSDTRFVPIAPAR